MYNQPFKQIALTLAISCVVGAVLASTLLGQSGFLTRAAGIASLFASPFVGFSIGAQIDYVRRRKEERSRRLLLFGLLAVAFAVLAFLVGTVTPPVIGQSENRFLFPSLFAIGFAASLFSGPQKF